MIPLHFDNLLKDFQSPSWIPVLISIPLRTLNNGQMQHNVTIETTLRNGWFIKTMCCLIPRTILIEGHSSGVTISQTMCNLPDHTYHHVTPMQWICLLSHTKWLQKPKRKNIEKKDIASNVLTKDIWLETALIDPNDWHEHMQQKQLRWLKQEVKKKVLPMDLRN
jgi:hypothetical protein